MNKQLIIGLIMLIIGLAGWVLTRTNFPGLFPLTLGFGIGVTLMSLNKEKGKNNILGGT